MTGDLLALRRLLVGVALAALMLQAIRLNYVVDDTFISLRYARNLIDGHGLSWNPGEPRVEGYTNFLWTLVMAVVLRLGLDPVVWAKGLGLAAALGVLLLSERLARRALPAPWSALVPLLLAANPAMVAWSGGGLETALFTLLVLGAAACALAAEPRVLPAGFLIGLACLTRPEGYFAIALIGLGVLLEQGRAGLFRLAPALWPVVLLGLPHEVFRVSYYDAWLPNTFHAKTGDLASQLRTGSIYLYRGIFAFAGGPLALAAAALAWNARRPGLRAAIVFVVGWCGYLLLVGGDGLPMFRFLVPALPFLALVLSGAVHRALEREPRALAVSAAAAMLFTAMTGWYGPERNYLEFDRKQFVPRVMRVGRVLRDLIGPDASIALLPAGAVPYYSGLRTVDMLALNDPVVARRRMPSGSGTLAGHSKYDAEAVVAQRPDYVLLGNVSVTAEPISDYIAPTFPAEAALIRLTAFREAYELVSFPLPDGDWLNAYRRRGAPKAPVAPREAAQALPFAR